MPVIIYLVRIYYVYYHKMKTIYKCHAYLPEIYNTTQPQHAVNSVLSTSKHPYILFYLQKRYVIYIRSIFDIYRTQLSILKIRELIMELQHIFP